MINVLFVCAGNICRSPMADAVFQHMVNEAGLNDQVKVDSAGMGSWHVGEHAHRGTLNVLKRHNIPYDGRARQFNRRDLDQFNYILAMDRENLSQIRHLERHDDNAEVSLFLHYANLAGLTNVTEVPDPYYSGVFDQVYDLVTMGCQALLDHIRQTHDL